MALCRTFCPAARIDRVRLPYYIPTLTTMAIVTGMRLAWRVAASAASSILAVCRH